jgi:hypothetical protein
VLAWVWGTSWWTVGRSRSLMSLGFACSLAWVVDTIVRLRCSPRVLETLQLCGVREISGVVLDRGNHDGPGSLR